MTTKLKFATFIKSTLLIGTAVLLGFTAIAAKAATQDEWPQWRGKNNTGRFAEGSLNPTSLSPSPKVLWETELGVGYASVSIAGPYLYTMGNISNQDIVYCLRADTGKEVWRYSYPCKASSYPGPRATPCVANNHVYTLSREGLALCLNAKTGDVVWQKHVAKEFGARVPSWGLSGSPIESDGMIFLNIATHGVALDARTGSAHWKSPAGPSGYSSPVVTTINGNKTVVMFGAKAIYGVDLKTGQELFSYPWETKYDVNAADPVIIGNRIFVSSGYGRGCALIDVSSAKPSVLWENKNLKNQFGTSVLIKGHLYGIDGNTGRAQLSCIDIKNGSIAWQENIKGGALIATGDLLVCLHESGDLKIIKATPTAYTEIASAKKLISRTCWTVPVLCRGKLYVRNEKGHLMCIDVR